MLRELIERAIQVKAAVVSADLREATSAGTRVGREVLNYGHTLGHAIERREQLPLAARRGDQRRPGVRRRAGPAGGPADRRARPIGTGRCWTALGLPTAYPADAFDDLLATMAVDKKTRGSTLRFVILNGLASAEILAGPPDELLRGAYAAVGGRERRPRTTSARRPTVVRRPGRRDPAGAWAGPGLGEWDLRALVGHTSRSLITVETYLRQPADAEDLASPADYLPAIGRVDASSVVERGRAAGTGVGRRPGRRSGRSSTGCCRCSIVTTTRW